MLFNLKLYYKKHVQSREIYSYKCTLEGQDTDVNERVSRKMHLADYGLSTERISIQRCFLLL